MRGEQAEIAAASIHVAAGGQLTFSDSQTEVIRRPDAIKVKSELVQTETQIETRVL